MSFSSETKEDLCHRPVERDCCALSEMAAFVHGIGTLRLSGAGQALVMCTEVPAVARRIFSLAKRLYGACPEVRTQLRRRLGRAHVYQVILGDAFPVPDILLNVGLTRLREGNLQFVHKAPTAITHKACCKHAYLRGAFLASGSLSDPEKGYHLEITAASQEYAASLSAFMNRLEIPSKVVSRKDVYVIYLKESETIVDTLNRIGAHKALLQMESIRVTKEVRNNVNRAVNCENANLDKTVDASRRQLEAIRTIERLQGLRRLPQPLLRMAEIRMEYPDAPLKELGEYFTPPVGKSGVNHRLRKLEEIARQLKERKGEC